MTRRERTLVLVMLGLAVVVAASFAARVHGTEGADMSAVVRAARMTAEIRTIEAQRVLPLGAPLPVFLERAAQDAGFTAATVEPGAGLARLAIPAVRPRAFFPWLDTLVRRHGLVVERLAATPNADQTLGVAVTLRTSPRSVP